MERLEFLIDAKTGNLLHFYFAYEENLEYICRERQYFAPMDYSIIKERRTLLGLTQQDLADYTGVSLRIIKSIEAGKGNPSVSTLSKIAEVLGLELRLQIREVAK